MPLGHWCWALAVKQGGRANQQPVLIVGGHIDTVRPPARPARPAKWQNFEIGLSVKARPVAGRL